MIKSALPDKNSAFGKEDWDVFLAQLDQSPERAGVVYERLRARLITFFRCRGLHCAEDHADETINRLIKATTNEQIRDPLAYALSVARYLASEVHRQRREVPLDEAEHLRDTYVSTEVNERRFSKQLACIEERIALLATEDQEILFSWYGHQKTEKIEEKKKLAARLGISLGTLRVRAFRVRERIRCTLQLAPNEGCETLPAGVYNPQLPGTKRNESALVS